MDRELRRLIVVGVALAVALFTGRALIGALWDADEATRQAQAMRAKLKAGAEAGSRPAREDLATATHERERLTAELARRPGLEVFPSQANHLLVRVDTAGDGAAAKLQRALMAKGVVVRSFDKPGPLSGCLRVTVGTPAEDDAFLAALDAIRPR